VDFQNPGLVFAWCSRRAQSFQAPGPWLLRGRRARKRRHSGYPSIMPYDPAKVTRAPPGYRPAAEAHDEQEGPAYGENNPPTWKDFIKAGNQARKMLKDLKR
jgi:hypothetical protein